MSVQTQFSAGTFCWADLGTTDTEKAQEFYSKLFGWSKFDKQSEHGVYTMQQLDGQSVCASFKNPEHSFWNLYISVDQLEPVMEKIRAAGGKVMMEPHDIPESGRMVLCQDPAGAMFSLWQAQGHAGGRTGAPGCMCWHELMSKDAAASATFYNQVFGWKAEAKDMGMPYNVFEMGGSQVGGMMQIGPHMGPIPSHWLVYFTVIDTDQTLAVAQEMGANVILPATDITGVGRISVMHDPTGAVFGVVAFPQ